MTWLRSLPPAELGHRSPWASAREARWLSASPSLIGYLALCCTARRFARRHPRPGRNWPSRTGHRRPVRGLAAGRSCAWYAYWDHSPLTELRAELRRGVFTGAFPTHGAQVLAFVQLPVSAWRPGHGEHDLRAGLARCPSVAAELDHAELPGRVIGDRDLPTYFRQAAGTGWALVGDAAHQKDPLAARGISDALLGAELLAGHVLRGWDSDLDQALHRYAAQLTRLLQPTAYLNDELARLDLPPDQARRTWQELDAAERQSYPRSGGVSSRTISGSGPARSSGAAGA
jgi:2-polyprenyl-6-methoxyphenol hydroxylase-like FAD-dependent oxidoreductase